MTTGITDRDGNPANPKDCAWVERQFTDEDKIVHRYRQCITHGHGHVIDEYAVCRHCGETGNHVCKPEELNAAPPTPKPH